MEVEYPQQLNKVFETYMAYDKYKNGCPSVGRIFESDVSVMAH
jgi:hypothetical protein